MSREELATLALAAVHSTYTLEAGISHLGIIIGISHLGISCTTFYIDIHLKQELATFIISTEGALYVILPYDYQAPTF